ncbi:hypothetical protein AB0C10_37595 [Microbispora amethystogenes]
MSPAQIKETLNTLRQAMTAAKDTPARPAVTTGTCTCPNCRKGAR